MNDFAGLPSHNRIDPQSFNQHGVTSVNYGPDPNSLVVLFYSRAVHNPHKSQEEGRPVFDNKDYVKIHHPGEKLMAIDRPVSDLDKRQYRERWAQYQDKRQQTPDGVPIDLLFPHHPNVAMTLKQYNIHTVEQLANLSGDALGNIGMGAQDWQTRAKNYMLQAEKGVNHHKFQKELDERDSRIKTLERQVQEMAAHFAQAKAQNDGKPALVQHQFPPANYDAQSHVIAGSMQERFPAPAKRGRRPGSKNKPKEETT